MNILFRVISIFFLLMSCSGHGFAQSEESGTAEKEFDLACEDTSPACTSVPPHIKTYLEVMDAILKIIDEVPSNASDPDPEKSITDATNAKRSNTQAFFNEVSDTLFNRDGVFDDYRFMEAGSATLKRDATKIQDMYFRILDVSPLVEKQLLKKNVSSEVYTKINNELKKLEYITLGKAGSQFNMEVAGKEYGVLMKLLSQINQVYAELYEEKFYTSLFVGLGKETFKSYTFPTDKSEEKIDDEKLNILAKQLVIFMDTMYVQPFDDLRDNVSIENEYVTIDFPKFALMIWELENTYRCTHGKQNVCSDGTKQIREDFKELFTETLASDVEKSRQRITDATSRLKGTFFGGNADDKKAAEERKQALLESRYGAGGKPSERSPMQSLQALGKQLLEGSKKSTDAIGYIREKVDYYKNKDSNQQVTELTQGPGNAYHEADDRYKTTSAKEDVLKSLASKWEGRLTEGDRTLPFGINLLQNQARILTTKAQSLESTFVAYSSQKQQDWMTDLIYLDTKTMTKQAVGLSIYVHAAANRFGDYDTDAGINTTLSLMCEAQCTNISSKKCREDL